MGVCVCLQVCADDLFKLGAGMFVGSADRRTRVAVRECTLTKRESRVEGAGQNHGIDLI